MREYAESFGVLDLCRHFGVPRRECHLEDERASHGHADPLRGEELVEDWLMWSRMLEAFLGLHVSVNAGNNGDPGRWACLLGSLSGRAAEAGESSRLSQRVEGEWFLSRQRLALLDPDTSFEDWHAALTLGEATRLLEFWVNLMLRAGRVSPRVRLTDHDEPRFELAAPDTFGAIARQLAGVAASIPSIKLCRGCGLTFAPDRGNQKWCHECKKNRVDFKLRQRAYRAR